MAIESIGRVAAPESAQSNSTVNLQDFLKIFLAQLKFQDPLEPVDNREFLAQLAQFSNVEISNRINEGVQSLNNIDSVSQVISMLGKDVEVAADEAGTGGIGKVVAVKFNNGDPLLTISTGAGPIDDVRPSTVTLVR
jgi:flagellar basal-body rod modification protein FlgD